jgi:phosphatidate cytidylyltransferase
MPGSDALGPGDRRGLGADFPRRALTAAIGAPLILLLTYLGGLPFSMMVVAVAVVATLELNGVIRPSRFGIGMLLVTMLACLLSILAHNLTIALATVAVMATLGLLESAQLPEARLMFFWRTWAFLILGAFYLAIPMALLILIRNMGGDQGLRWVVCFFCANWSTDVFALVGGRLWGRTKIAPHISPGKTIEGALIGMGSGIVLGALVGALLGLPMPVVLIAVCVITVMTVAGDLLESWLKRRFHVKDTGNLLPGHGGVLDRVDGALLAVPGLWLVLTLFSIR